MPRNKPIMKCGFKTKKDNAHVHAVSFNDLTDGEILALIHALQIGAMASPVAQDLLAYLRNGIFSSDSIGAARFLEEFDTEIAVKIVKKDDG